MALVPCRLSSAAALALLACLPATAEAANWGSFDGSRMAYSTGSLTASNHTDLRDVITANGDTVETATSTLTAEYLMTVDVFYTAMLSDGTGPTAGDLGTLSADEAMALADWIAQGGTLIVTADSNGFGGPWEGVYDSFTGPYGVAGYVFSGGEVEVTSLLEHPITAGISTVEADGLTSYALPPEAEIIGYGATDRDPYAAVFEPTTGFAEGGRILLLSDHNTLTDPFMAMADNTAFAENIVEWAAGECGNTIVESGEECDDGNLIDGDGCSSACAEEAGGSDTGDSGDSDSSGEPATGTETGHDDTTDGGPISSSDGGNDTTAGPGDATAGDDDSPSTTNPGSGGSEEGSTGSSADDDGDDSSGCSCRTSDSPGPLPLALVLLGLAARRRRR